MSDIASSYEHLSTLSVRERRVIILRFGLAAEWGQMTLEQIGKIFGITRERIRQIEAKALKKLKKRMSHTNVQEVFVL